MSKLRPLPEDSLAYSLRQSAGILCQVFAGQSLAEGQLARIPAVARPAVQDFTYSTLRQYGRGDYYLDQLLDKPLAAPEVHALLLVALQRLEQRPESVHTTVDQAVIAAETLEHGRFKNLVNAVLRNFLRRQTTLHDQLAAEPLRAFAHPDWWIQKLQARYPERWREIAQTGNQPPPMAVRVNQRRIDATSWLTLFEEGDAGVLRDDHGAVLLKRPMAVDRLPGFYEGLVSVQDLGAQKAAHLLQPSKGERVLDACAAPGGKAAHLLELADIELLALDLKPSRCRRVEENLARLQLSAKVLAADCAKLDSWWDGRPFDAVLADVPCSASGVVRRNPDIKWLRRPEDVASFAATQKRLLHALWQVVRPGGKLLYVTCSLFPEENEQQISAFLAANPAAVKRHEEQLLPDAERDGFYYCLLQKAL